MSYHHLVEQYPSIQRFSEGAGVLITDILHCAFGNQWHQLFN
ncbi:TPA: cytoplasmic protein [Salmonella enterica]|uniref:Cytoplasmic protein n=1 Tax=Salmonella enterica subsp. salamae TaxID=59202 RepID=A0A702LKE3_SALER|nr:cytoplasmic protein [Salmonella enterica subsp. salamae serovar 9,46:l,w:e,n,x]HAC6954355.1 cytoplasmic protein [Salmonella enterica subsp. salamae]HCL5292463.1 cytoplasmic protein [Salmonella enterica]